jgi:hypothetical protein
MWSTNQSCKISSPKRNIINYNISQNIVKLYCTFRKQKLKSSLEGSNIVHSATCFCSHQDKWFFFHKELPRSTCHWVTKYQRVADGGKRILFKIKIAVTPSSPCGNPNNKISPSYLTESNCFSPDKPDDTETSKILKD